jgi:hypothetical protein
MSATSGRIPLSRQASGKSRHANYQGNNEHFSGSVVSVFGEYISIASHRAFCQPFRHDQKQIISNRVLFLRFGRA